MNAGLPVRCLRKVSKANQNKVLHMGGETEGRLAGLPHCVGEELLRFLLLGLRDRDLPVGFFT